LFLFSVETGEKRRLTTPPVAVANADAAPAFSPDGRTLAFVRWNLAEEGWLYLLHVGPGYRPQGEPEKVAFEGDVTFSAAWMPDGREIVLAARSGPTFGLWRVSAQNHAPSRRLAVTAERPVTPSISPIGNRLAYSAGRFDSNIWQVKVSADGEKQTRPVPIIASTKPDYYPMYSPDGKKIAFNSHRSGRPEVWVADADGSNPTQLTSFGGPAPFGPRWSPDGGTVVFALSATDKTELYAVAANGGKPRRLITGSDQCQWPYWSRNGEWIYFASDHNGQTDIWKMPTKGGKAIQLTHNGGDHPEESPDGKLIYYNKGWPHVVSVWRVPVGGGDEVKVIDAVHTQGQWSGWKRGIYFFTPPDKRGRSDVRYYDFAMAKTKTLLSIKAEIGYSMAASPDGRTIVYTQVDEEASDLMLVEHFR
jgi:Tol biopolymer transport system component